MVELKGSLGSIGLAAIVQLIGELQHSGNLELTRGTARAVLGFEDGRLVAASYDEQRGLRALDACKRELADADFLFVEGEPSDERTIDLPGSQLQNYLAGRGDGSAETIAQGVQPPPGKANQPPALGACPHLGFVDDPSRHYSRATALHRCFAEGLPGLVTGQEQRDLCLSGRYPECPRFPAASIPEASMPTAAAPPAPSRPAVSRPVPPEVPAGVAARLAAAGQMRLAAEPSTEALAPWGGQGAHEPRGSETGAARTSMFRRRPTRTVVLVAVGVGLGLLVLVAGLVFVGPALRNVFGPKSPAVAVQPSAAASSATALQASTPAPAAAASAAASAPTSAVSAGAAATPSNATAVRAAQPSPSAQAAISSPPTAPTAVVASQVLVDERFASGAKEGWIENPPFATWSDGAYRLKAAQPKRFVAVSAPIEQPLSDVIVSATFRKTGGGPGGGYGLIIRDQSPDPLDGANQDGSLYVVEAGDRGEFGVWRRDGDHWVDLVPWTPTASVQVGGSPNDLTVRAIGDRITFLVNGKQLADIHDDALGAGRVGVFVGGDYNEVALDRFVVEIPN